MASERSLQFLRGAVWILALGLLLFFAAIMFSPLTAFAGPSSTDTAAEIITASAVWPVIGWCFGWPVLFAWRRDPSHVFGDLAALGRIIWTLGYVLLLLHIAVAFHVGHGWSHEIAWNHTKQVGGYGDGIYVNYLFALVWLADVIWLWVSFRSYSSRPRWLKWSVFLFQAFIVVNATVIFATTWSTRLFYLFAFLGSAVFLWQTWRAVRQHDALRDQSKPPQ